MATPHAPTLEAHRKTIHLTISLTEEDAELLDMLRVRLGDVAGDAAPFSHARVVRLAVRHLAAAWKLGPAPERHSPWQR